MAKKIIFLILFFIVCPILCFAGEGPIAKEQPGLMEKCNSWKLGDKIPNYFLIDDSQFNPMSQYKPSAYINKLNNEELLFSLITDLKSPSRNSDVAFGRLLDKLGLGGFELYLDDMLKKPEFAKNPKMVGLKRIFSEKCVKAYKFFIDLDDMTKDEVTKILSEMKAEIVSGKNYMEVYEYYRQKYEYPNPEYPKQLLTKVGNGGDFYISLSTREIFPPYLAFRVPKEDLTVILNLKKGDSIILEEKISEEGRGMRSRYGKMIALSTDNRMNLYVIIDEIPGSGQKGMKQYINSRATP